MPVKDETRNIIAARAFVTHYIYTYIAAHTTVVQNTFRPPPIVALQYRYDVATTYPTAKRATVTMCVCVCVCADNNNNNIVNYDLMMLLRSSAFERRGDITCNKPHWAIDVHRFSSRESRIVWENRLRVSGYYGAHRDAAVAR